MGRLGGLLLLAAALGGARAGLCRPRAPCDACIRSHPQCAWCEEPGFTRGGRAEATRCGPRAALRRLGCPAGTIVEPRGRVRELRNGDAGDGSAQLSPRAVTVTLRPGEERSFQVRFRRAAACPVDLYYLMDLSYSMKDDLATVRGLGSAVLAALHNASRSVRIGFGSFVDKPVLPFASTAPARLRHPCPERHEACVAPAAFRHVLPLTANGSEFARRVGRQRISGNLDSPEGGLDAIMQVALCQEQIGWRPFTRLLVFATDDTFHTAGDGKLAGIVTPSDSRCHLDTSGVYSKSHLYDYPSVGHLAQVLAAADIQPIFAVTRPAVPVYQALSRLLPRAVVGELREDSSNVVQLISAAYASLSSTVELQHSPLPPGVTLSYESHCGSPPGPSQPHGGFCSGVGVGQQVNFTVRVRVGGCLAAPAAVVLRVPGLGERLRLELRSLCSCPCAPPAPAPHCRGGRLHCGLCSCPPGRWGPRCECEGPAGGGRCHPPSGNISTSPSAPPCSPGGCERHRGLPCGGPARGTCVCGRCRCRPGYAGPSCERCPSCQSPCERYRACAECVAAAGGAPRGGCWGVCGAVSPRVLPARPPGARPPAWCAQRGARGRLLLFLLEGHEDGADLALSVWAEDPVPVGLVAVLLVAPVAAVVAPGLLLLLLLRGALHVRARRCHEHPVLRSAAAPNGPRDGRRH